MKYKLIVIWLILATPLFGQQYARTGLYVGDSTNTGIFSSNDSDSLYIVTSGDSLLVSDGITLPAGKSIKIGNYTAIDFNADNKTLSIANDMAFISSANKNL